MTQYICGTCGLSSSRGTPTMHILIIEDKLKEIGKLTSYRIFFFFTHDHDKCGDIDVQQIRSEDNLADLFTKTLPTTMFEKLRCNIEI
jgi:hypothetical protein